MREDRWFIISDCEVPYTILQLPFVTMISFCVIVLVTVNCSLLPVVAPYDSHIMTCSDCDWVFVRLTLVGDGRGSLRCSLKWFKCPPTLLHHIRFYDLRYPKIRKEDGTTPLVRSTWFYSEWLDGNDSRENLLFLYEEYRYSKSDRTRLGQIIMFMSTLDFWHLYCFALLLPFTLNH